MGVIIAFLMMGFAFFVMGLVIYKTAVGISGKTSLRGIAVKRESGKSISYNQCEKLNGIKDKAISFKKNESIEISLDVECKKGNVLINIKDNNGEIIVSDNKSKELFYKINENNKLFIEIKFEDFYGNVKLNFR